MRGSQHEASGAQSVGDRVLQNSCVAFVVSEKACRGSEKAAKPLFHFEIRAFKVKSLPHHGREVGGCMHSPTVTHTVQL